MYLNICDNSNDFSYNLGKLDKHEEMAHCDISFHTQMICLHHIGTIHILRKHNLGLFLPPPPVPYVSMFWK